MSQTKKSAQLYEQSKKYLVGGTASALHKADWQPYPIYIKRGQGAKLIDVDDNEYIDYVGAFGPMILGYAAEQITEALVKQIEMGTHFAAPTESILELSDKLVRIIPSAEMVSYQCTGTEANMHAFRLARAYTGKKKILKFEGHYHGWSDEEKVSCSADSLTEMGPRDNPRKILGALGQREADDVLVVPYNNLDYLENLLEREGGKIAALILETVMCNVEPVFPKEGFLEGVRALTKKHGIVLIFDEVITGFRLSLGGGQGFFGVTPDLSTFGKALGGGVPIALVVGKEEIMAASPTPVGTFNGNPLSVAASLATLAVLENKDTYVNFEQITGLLADGLTALGRRYGIKLLSKAIGSIWTLQFGIDTPLLDYRDHFGKIDKETYRVVFEQALAQGVRLHPFRGRYYISTAHTQEDAKQTLEVFERIFSKL